jgi:hypothetical protein
MLAPTLLIGGIVAGALSVSNADQIRNSAAEIESAAAEALVADSLRVSEIEKNRYMDQVPDVNKPKQIDDELLLGHKQAKEDLIRAERISAALAWSGMLLGVFVWLTAFLSVWWWFGARLKPREGQ